VWQLPASVWKSWQVLGKRRARAVFSMGGSVAAPVMLAAAVRGVPMAVMEPNALPGLVTRKMGSRVKKALLAFEEAKRYFPAGVTEITGLPVREEFFALPERRAGAMLNVLVTGGSRGSKALNKAARESWRYFRQGSAGVRFTLQCGADEYETLAREFNETRLDGEVTAFIHDMPGAYAEADLVVSRSGAGAVSELAAAGKPSILVPFPFAADDHQRHNAEAMARVGAARVYTEGEWTGERLYDTVLSLSTDREQLAQMGRAARAQAKPGAARRAAEILLEIAARA
jgi:UDP-N-acetylglucosamine--N-acetylmuramyl-(pentapeptide) pyrophosphoryl-undecaprenol N-acetylglucosamine transferase